mmetsp:Transcript_7876/g.7365  ORF Transcript_7876/g.7365 Transcript_7876/m.7365 type:complete len:198 (+) Transcript_7876:725-1318(+)
MGHRKAQLEERVSSLEKQIDVREDEIRRLHTLYEGGQNLEKLNLKYLQTNNEKAVQKLHNQVEFLNKENHRLQRSVDHLSGGDKGVVDEIQELRKEIQDLSFENSSLRKDLKECSRLLKDYQEQDFENKKKPLSLEEEQKLNSAHERISELEGENERLKGDMQKLDQLRAAYNADKKAFTEKIDDLEAKVKGSGSAK